MIHDVILDHLQENLEDALITSAPLDDKARAGIVKIGPLQGDPDPDVAVISVTLHENDPDTVYGGKSMSAKTWLDEVYEVECGGSITWRRRFTVKVRCLFTNKQYDLHTARLVASTVRSRIETKLLTTDWNEIVDEETNEYISRGVFSDNIESEQVQSGGPPDQYDFQVKIRFELLTTRSTNT